MKIRPVGAEFHTDGRADMTKLIVAYRSFANAPRNECEENVSALLKYNGEFSVAFYSTFPSLTCLRLNSELRKTARPDVSKERTAFVVKGLESCRAYKLLQ